LSLPGRNLGAVDNVDRGAMFSNWRKVNQEMAALQRAAGGSIDGGACRQYPLPDEGEEQCRDRRTDADLTRWQRPPD